MRPPAQNATFLFVGEVLTRVLGFLVAALLARRLGVAGFGQIGFAMSILAYGVMFSRFGLLAVGVRESAQDRTRIPLLARNIFGLRLILSCLAVVGIAVFALLARREASVRWLLVVFAFGVVAQSLLLEWVFTGIERMEYVAMAGVLTNSAYFLLVLVLVRGLGQMLLVPVAFVLANLLGAGALFVPYIRTFGWLRPGLERSTCRELVRRAWPVGTASVLTQFYAHFGIVGLALLRTDHDAGIYTAAHRLAFALLMVDRIFQAVFFPVISRYVKNRAERLPELAGAALRVVVAAGVLVCLGILLLAGPAVRFAFDAGYEESAAVLRVLSLFVPLSLLTSLAGYTVLAAGQELRFCRNTAIGVGVGAAAAVAGIAAWGPVGAAAAMVLGETCLLVFMGYDCVRLSRPRLSWRVAVPLLAGVPMAALILLLRDWNWVVAGLAGCTAYAGVLFAARGVTLHDLGVARR